MTNKELNLLIKKELKKANYNAREFSVSVKDAGYSTSIRVVIKSPHINRKEIKKLLQHYNEVDRDRVTGEVLAGGNTYLFIDYADGVFDEVAQEYAEIAKNVLESTDETTKIFDGLYLINWEKSGNFEIRQQNAEGHNSFKCYDFKELCIFIYKFAKFADIAV